MSLWWSVRGDTFVFTGYVVVAVGSRGMLPTVWFGLVCVASRGRDGPEQPQLRR